MAGYHFCTIASPDFLPFAEALHHSLLKQSKDVYLHVLVIDEQSRANKENCFFYNLSDIQYDDKASEIIEKYRTESNLLRWAIKAPFLIHLLKQHDKIFYADNDLYFFGKFDFLFGMLDDASLVVSPHWCSIEPLPHQENFRMNFQAGLFNAGFVGATTGAISFLNWWAGVCLYKMSRKLEEGFFDDQRYLDLATIAHEKTAILRHLGCNIGSWNMHQNKRVRMDNEILINGEFTIVFIHFNEETIKHIANGNDALLQPHLKEYETAVVGAGGDIYNQKSLPGIVKQPSKNFKQKLRLRTRLKKWLYYLSQKL